MSRPSKQLTDLWYKKLEKSGFKDLEDKEGRLKEYVSSRSLPSRKYHNGLVAEIRARYYELASSFLNSYTEFKGKDKKMWDLHSQGYTVRQIAQKIGFNPSWTHTKISRIKSIMFSIYGLDK